MGEENKGDNMEKETPAAPPAEEKIDQPEKPNVSEDDKPQDGKEDDDLMIPKSRFDEVSTQAKTTKKDLEEVKRKFEKSEKSREDLQSKLETIANGLTGNKGDDETDPELKELAEEFGVDSSFLVKMAGLMDSRNKKNLETNLQPVKQHQANEYFDKEFNQLSEKYPDAKEMKDDLKKQAFKKENLQVSLENIYKMETYDKVQGQSNPVEPGSGGEKGYESDKVDIGKMTPDEFEKWSNDLAKNDK